MQIDLLKDIVQAFGEYCAPPRTGGDLRDFATWLYARTGEQSTTTTIPHPAIGPGETIDSVIGKLVVFMNRYVKAYVKKAMEGQPVASADEFVFLIYLHMRGPATKTTLIQAARMDKPTGMEILRRLEKAGFTDEAPHPVDKRSKILRITPPGIAALAAAFQPMGQVGSLITGDLNTVEKQELLRLLLKLEAFHEPLQRILTKKGWKTALETAVAHDSAKKVGSAAPNSVLLP